MPKKILTLLTALLGLCSCATTQKYETVLNGELGKTAQELQSSWGMPTKVKKLSNGNEIITYLTVNYQVLPDPSYDFNNGFLTEDEMFYPFTYGGSALPVGSYMGDVVTEWCKTDFYLKNGIITSWQWKGNACVAL
jgi:hypothetical protein